MYSKNFCDFLLHILHNLSDRCVHIIGMGPWQIYLYKPDTPEQDVQFYSTGQVVTYSLLLPNNICGKVMF